jgi:hypothetical protein
LRAKEIYLFHVFLTTTIICWNFKRDYTSHPVKDIFSQTRKREDTGILMFSKSWAQHAKYGRNKKIIIHLMIYSSGRDLEEA